MQADAVAKIVKAAIILASLAGYNLDPEKIHIIIEGAAAAYAVVASVEAWIKHKKEG